MINLKFKVDTEIEYKIILTLLRDMYPSADISRVSKYLYRGVEEPVRCIYISQYKNDDYPKISTGINLACFYAYPALDLSNIDYLASNEYLKIWVEEQSNKVSNSEKYKFESAIGERTDWVVVEPESRMTDAMIDIETLGTKPGYIVLSGAIRLFNIKTGDLGDYRNFKIDLAESIFEGFKIDLGTVDWWRKQTLEAFQMAMGQGSSIEATLDYIDDFFHERADLSEIRVWGNGQRFDLGLLARYYEHLDREVPWNTFMERDVRTLVMHAPQIKAIHIMKEGERTTTHKPLQDCDDQIAYCVDIFNRIKVEA